MATWNCCQKRVKEGNDKMKTLYLSQTERDLILGTLSVEQKKLSE